MVDFEDIVSRRTALLVAGRPLPRERFSVFRVKASSQFQEEFWSFADREDAEALSQLLIAKEFDAAYVFDTAGGEKVFEITGNGLRPAS